MAKKEKIVSFETMNRKEYITDTVTAVMVAGILMCVLRGLLHFPITWISEALYGGGWQFYLRTLLTTLLSTVGLTLPLFLYGLAVDSHVKPVLKKRSPNSLSENLSVGIAGCVAAVAAAILCLRLSFLAMDTASLGGFVFTVNAPDAGATMGENLFFILVNAIIPAVICEPFYRGVVMNRLSKDSYFLAVLIPAIIFSANHPNIPQMPYMFAVGIIIGLVYLKTEDIIFPMIIHAVVNGAIAYLYVSAGSPENFTLKNTSALILMGILLILSGVIVITSSRLRKKHAPEDKPFTIKESLRGLFGTFGIYVLMIVVLFQLGAWHIDNPTFEIDGDKPVQEEVQSQGSTSE